MAIMNAIYDDPELRRLLDELVHPDWVAPPRHETVSPSLSVLFSDECMDVAIPSPPPSPERFSLSEPSPS